MNTKLPQAIRVYIRPRSNNGIESDNSSQNINGISKHDKTTYCRDSLSIPRFRTNHVEITQNINGITKHDKTTTFPFHHVYSTEASQEEIFDSVGREMVNKTLQGYNGSILAYGETGSGKTYSMIGDKKRYDSRGLAPRTVEAFFEAKEDDSSITIRFSALEIYNDKLIDLLRSFDDEDSTIGGLELDGQDDTSKSDNILEIRETLTNGMIVVKGLKCPIVNDITTALDFMFEAQMNRIIAKHQLNSESTRSHVIFSFYIDSLDEMNKTPVHGKLHLVDLAGSERIEKTMSTGDTAVEAVHINKSLSFLEQVVLALGEKSRDHIPYRQSKLTHFLKDSLGGSSITSLVACVWPTNAHIEETISTLNFASRMSRLKTTAVRNTTTSSSAEGASEALKAAYEEIASLKEEISMYDAVSGRDTSEYYLNNYTITKKQLDHTDNLVNIFVHGDGTQYPPIINLQQTRAVFDSFYNLFQTQVNNSKISSLVPVPEKNITSISSVIPEVPTSSSPPMKTKETRITSNKANTILATDSQLHSYTPSLTVTQEEAFEMYKNDEGEALNIELLEGKQGIRELKQKTGDMIKELKSAKSDVEKWMKIIEESGEATNNNSDNLRELKQVKRKYKHIMEELKERKSELDYLKRMVASSRSLLISEFHKWYDKNILKNTGVGDHDSLPTDSKNNIPLAKSNEDTERPLSVMSVASSISEEESKQIMYLNAGERASKYNKIRQKTKPSRSTNSKLAFGSKPITRK